MGSMDGVYSANTDIKENGFKRLKERKLTKRELLEEDQLFDKEKRQMDDIVNEDKYASNYIPNDHIELKYKYHTIDDVKDNPDILTLTKNDTLLDSSLPQVVTCDTEEVNTKDIYIDFYKITGDESLKDEDGKLFDLYNQHMDARAYVTKLNFIVYDLNFIFNEKPILAYQYLAIKQKILYDKFYSEEEFLQDIKEFTYQPLFRDLIATIVESTYTLELDKKKKVNAIDDLQVTDATNKAILQTALTSRIIIPLICEFLAVNKVPAKYKDTVYFKIFRRILVVYSRSYDVDILSKFRKIVQPRVTKTQYVHKKIWSYFSFATIDPSLVIHETTYSIIRQILSKMALNRSSISFFDVVIRTKLTYKFKAKLSWNYRAIQLNTAYDSDEMDETDRQALIWQHRTNDVSVLTNELSMKSYIKDSIIKYNITSDYINEVKNGLRFINSFQRTLLTQYFHNEFKIQSFSSNDALLLLIIMEKELESMKKYPVLRNIILSKRVDDGSRRMTSNKNSKTLLESETLVSVMKKYISTDSIIERQNPILSVGNISNYEFAKYNGDTVEPFSRDTIIQEYADLLNYCTIK